MSQLHTILSKMHDLDAAGESYALATVVRAESPTAAKAGAKALILKDGTIDGWIGGGCAQPAVRKTALQCMQDGESRLIRVHPLGASQSLPEGVIDFPMNCPSEGTLEIFIDPIDARPTVGIFGNSQAAQALESLAAQVGFKVERLEGAITSQPHFIVIMTQGQGDQAALASALDTDAPYITFVASQRKANKLMQSLKDKGHSAQKVDAIHSPAGIDIGTETPEEVALSVLAALVAERRKDKQFIAPSASSHSGESKAEATSCCSTSADSTSTQTSAVKAAPAVDVSSCCSSDTAPEATPETTQKKVG